MRLFEIALMEAVEYKWRYDTTAEFTVNGMKYLVDFIPMYNGTDDEYDFEFQAVGGHTKFGNNNQMGSSSIQVFSTVVQISLEFIKREKPTKVRFTGDKKENRVPLYTKLVAKIKGQLASMGYSVSTQDNDKNAEFVISKNVQEAVIKLGKGAEEGSPAKMMVAAFNGETEDHPYNQRLRTSNNAMANIYPLSNSTVRIGDIQGSGNGTGSAMLKKITDLADKYGVTIKLDAYGYEDEDKLTTKELVKWYSRNGFSVVDQDDDVVNMIREPR